MLSQRAFFVFTCALHQGVPSVHFKHPSDEAFPSDVRASDGLSAVSAWLSTVVPGCQWIYRAGTAGASQASATRDRAADLSCAATYWRVIYLCHFSAAPHTMQPLVEGVYSGLPGGY